MASPSSAQHGDAPVDSAAARAPQTLPTVLGDCAIHLSHATSYEPPLYLFPQLLPQVPQGTAPITVWDAVAGAVDVAASYWHMADASSLLTASNGRTGQARSATAGSSASKKSAMVTLASLLSANKLVPLGLHASVLENGAFSAASMLQELAALQARAGLDDEEAAVLMSNHFVNLLAWKKLREINDPAPLCVLPETRASQEESEASEPKSTSGTKKAASRKRAREDALAKDDADTGVDAPHTEVEDVLAQLQASPDPWTDVVNDPAQAGTFIAGGEKDVEKRVQLLHTLSALYRRPWKPLCSAGVQTDLVVPPGTVNTTSPFVDHRHVPGAQLDPQTDLGWTDKALSMRPASIRVGASEPANTEGSAERDGGATAPFTVCVEAAGERAIDAAPQKVVLVATTTVFGRAAGPQRTPTMGSVNVDVGLAQYTARPELLSEVHFALMLRPVFGVTVSGSTHARAATDDTDGCAQGSASSSSASETGASVAHTKTPTSYKLFVVNYSRNGVRVVGRRWVLGDVMELHAGDELRVGGDAVVVKVSGLSASLLETEAHHTAFGSVVKEEKPGLTPVKHESADE